MKITSLTEQEQKTLAEKYPEGVPQWALDRCETMDEIDEVMAMRRKAFPATNQSLPVPTATLVPTGEGFKIEVVWSGNLDRPNVGGWLFGKKEKAIAARLVAAINAGKVYATPEIKTDVNGKTYVHAETTQFFHKRHMNVSLKAIGF